MVLVSPNIVQSQVVFSHMNDFSVFSPHHLNHPRVSAQWSQYRLRCEIRNEITSEYGENNSFFDFTNYAIWKKSSKVFELH